MIRNPGGQQYLSNISDRPLLSLITLVKFWSKVNRPQGRILYLVSGYNFFRGKVFLFLGGGGYNQQLFDVFSLKLEGGLRWISQKSPPCGDLGFPPSSQT